ncbi:hypothetical protein HYH03_004457 [Edaphochlamys debaryana]|uniref:Protein kinase domain-containing protein n=1 Tax=Edaphochlamys debaryana TaxID=47281 RepID=A0A835YBD6_9CHLO|nr:hypothetical protein HYH03_004457 [Edaphochlamys debaryana]|eukprot:KAG2497721.1 hypothetical protein HYH03_004457 [Edaphochlamys debaryana]
MPFLACFCIGKRHAPRDSDDSGDAKAAVPPLRPNGLGVVAELEAALFQDLHGLAPRPQTWVEHAQATLQCLQSGLGAEQTHLAIFSGSTGLAYVLSPPRGAPPGPPGASSAAPSLGQQTAAAAAAFGAALNPDAPPAGPAAAAPAAAAAAAPTMAAAAAAAAAGSGPRPAPVLLTCAGEARPVFPLEESGDAPAAAATTGASLPPATGAGWTPGVLPSSPTSPSAPSASFTPVALVHRGDLLALPLPLRGRMVGALLVGWAGPGSRSGPALAQPHRAQSEGVRQGQGPRPGPSRAISGPPGAHASADASGRAAHSSRPGLAGADVLGLPKQLSAADVRALERLSHAVLYGMFAMPEQEAFLSLLADCLVPLPRAASVQQLMGSALAAVRELLRARTGLDLVPVMAAAHGPSAPAALFALRASPDDSAACGLSPGVGGVVGVIRHGASGGGVGVGAGAAGTGVRLSGSQYGEKAGAWHEAGRRPADGLQVKAAVMPLHQTLLASAVGRSRLASGTGGLGGAELSSAGPGGPASPGSIQSPFVTLQASPGVILRRAMPPARPPGFAQPGGAGHVGLGLGPAGPVPAGGGPEALTGAGAMGAGRGSVWQPFTQMVPDASALLLDAAAACADVQAVARLAALPRVASLVLCCEEAPPAGPSQAQSLGPSRAHPGPSRAGRGVSSPLFSLAPPQAGSNAGSASGVAPDGTSLPSTEAPWGPAGAHAAGPTGALSGGLSWFPAPGGLPPPSPPQLGVYVLSPEALPGSLVAVVASELETILELVLRSCHRMLAGRLAVEWEGVRIQLLTGSGSQVGSGFEGLQNPRALHGMSSPTPTPTPARSSNPNPALAASPGVPTGAGTADSSALGLALPGGRNSPSLGPAVGSGPGIGSGFGIGSGPNARQPSQARKVARVVGSMLSTEGPGASVEGSPGVGGVMGPGGPGMGLGAPGSLQKLSYASHSGTGMVGAAGMAAPGGVVAVGWEPPPSLLDTGTTTLLETSLSESAVPVPRLLRGQSQPVVFSRPSVVLEPLAPHSAMDLLIHTIQQHLQQAAAGAGTAAAAQNLAAALAAAQGSGGGAAAAAAAALLAGGRVSRPGMPNPAAASGAAAVPHQADLAALQLYEALGRGGQGVVLRGSWGGLETAVKAIAQRGAGGGEGDKAQGPGQAQAAGQAAQGQGQAAAQAQGQAAAGSIGGVAGDGEGEAGGEEGGERRIKRRLLRGAVELAVSASLSHPHIVAVYAVFTDVAIVRVRESSRPPRTSASFSAASPAPAPPPPPAPTHLRLVHRDDPLLQGMTGPVPLYSAICLEFCDAGTLLTASRGGAFRLPPPEGAATPSAAATPLFRPALVPLYTTLLEVALGLRHMHLRRLVHGDLKPANVLLKGSVRDPRGWTCKLSDFGCARLLTEADVAAGGVRQPNPSGTLAYMGPELLTQGGMQGFHTDVYAFGVLMWELMAGTSPHPRVDPASLPRLVVRQGLRPAFPPTAPTEYCTLAALCWARQPATRPTAAQLVERLQLLLERARADAAAAAQRRSAFASALQSSSGLPPSRSSGGGGGGGSMSPPAGAGLQRGLPPAAAAAAAPSAAAPSAVAPSGTGWAGAAPLRPGPAAPAAAAAGGAAAAAAAPWGSPLVTPGGAAAAAVLAARGAAGAARPAAALAPSASPGGGAAAPIRRSLSGSAITLSPHRPTIAVAVPAAAAALPPPLPAPPPPPVLPPAGQAAPPVVPIDVGRDPAPPLGPHPRLHAHAPAMLPLPYAPPDALAALAGQAATAAFASPLASASMRAGAVASEGGRDGPGLDRGGPDLALGLGLGASSGAGPSGGWLAESPSPTSAAANHVVSVAGAAAGGWSPALSPTPAAVPGPTLAPAPLPPAAPAFAGPAATALYTRASAPAAASDSSSAGPSQPHPAYGLHAVASLLDPSTLLAPAPAQAQAQAQRQAQAQAPPSQRVGLAEAGSEQLFGGDGEEPRALLREGPGPVEAHQGPGPVSRLTRDESAEEGLADMGDELGDGPEPGPGPGPGPF